MKSLGQLLKTCDMKNKAHMHFYNSIIDAVLAGPFDGSEPVQGFCTDVKRLILANMSDGKEWTTKALYIAIPAHYNVINRKLSQLARDGVIERLERGVYKIK